MSDKPFTYNSAFKDGENYARCTNAPQWYRFASLSDMPDGSWVLWDRVVVKSPTYVSVILKAKRPPFYAYGPLPSIPVDL